MAVVSAAFVVLIGIFAFGLVSRKNKAHQFETVTINSIISNLSLTETGSLKVSEELFGVARGKNIKGIIRFFPGTLPVKSGIVAPKILNLTGLNTNTFEPLFLKEEPSKDKNSLKIGLAEDKPLSGNFSFRLDYELDGLVLNTASGRYLFFKQIWNHSTSIGKASVTLNLNHFDVSALKAWIDLNEYIQVRAGEAQAYLPKSDESSVLVNIEGNEAKVISTRRLAPFESISIMVPLL